MQKENFLFFIVLLLLIFSCKKNDKTIEEAEEITIEVPIVRLDRELFQLNSPAQTSVLLDHHPFFVQEFITQGATSVPPDSILARDIYSFYKNPELEKFYEEAQKEFGNFSDIKRDFTHLFQYIRYYYPDFRVPVIEPVITGFRFDKDLAVGDSVIIISYDYFLGSGTSFKPPLFDYFLMRYQKPYLVPMVAQAISSRYNHADLRDKTMLATMIYYGKAHYFVERMMPLLPDSLNIMYSDKELENCQNHIDAIWGHFIEKKLLFNKTRFLVEKYCGERPNVLEIGDQCPGRIGRWLGWQIVRSYMKNNPEITLQELMQDQDAGKIFRKSNYKPR